MVLHRPVEPAPHYRDVAQGVAADMVTFRERSHQTHTPAAGYDEHFDKQIESTLIHFPIYIN
jgi:hypothetical protein